jgi:hypothetical protein
MQADERYSGGGDAPGVQLTPLAPRRDTSPTRPQDPGAHPAGRAWWPAAAWTGGAIALFAILFRISNSFPMDSDAANNALQAWDMLHGNLLLHGWIIGDATYYTFELPLYALLESLFGLHTVVVHIGSALVYLIVAACAIAVARTGSRGPSAWIRAAIVVAVMAATLLTRSGVSIAVEKPDHTGTAAITLLCILIVDRLSGRRWMPALLCLILTLGQVGDATVLYVAVPSIAAVSLYRIIFQPQASLTERLRMPEMLTFVAAGVSVLLAHLARDGLEHLGAYSMVPPQNGIAPWSHVPHNLWLTGRALSVLFGTLNTQGSRLGLVGMGFGWLCIAAGLYGFGKVLWRWHRASRAEQLVCAAIVVNIAAYAFSTLPVASNSRELIAVVPCSAVLAARALVPERIQSAARARVMIAIAAVAVVLPLAAEATVPTGAGIQTPVAAWLEAHGLKYGIGGYWNASAVTLQSGGQVQVIAVQGGYKGIASNNWETNAFWYDPRLHYANFAIADMAKSEAGNNMPAKVFERAFGRPASIHRVADKLILIYDKNLLRQVLSPLWRPVAHHRTARRSGRRHRRR